MARIALIGIVIAVFIWLVRVFFPSSSDKKQASGTREMVKDPNCETYVPKTEALEKTVGEKQFYFCSEKCAEEYTQKNA